MFLTNESNKLWIYIVIAGVVVLLIAAIVIFIIKKSGKKQYLVKLDNLLNEIQISNKSQLNAYIARLKTISTKNEDFIEVYQQLSAQLNKIETTDWEKLVTRQKGLKDRVNTEKIKKGLLDQIKSFENAVIQYKKDINNIQRDLESYLAECDTLRIQLTELQNQYQQVKSDLEKYSASLSLCKDALSEYVGNIEVYFSLLDEYILSAKYNDAKNKIDKIKGDLLNVYGQVETIAQFCNILEVVIPEQLEDLKNKNIELEQKGYVVAHAKVYETIESINRLLEKTKREFSLLNFSSFEEVSNKISDKITEVHARLDQEVISKGELDKKHAIVSEKVKKCDVEFIKTKRQYYSMQEYYKLPEDVDAKFNAFQSNATLLTSLNTEYNGFLFTGAKHSASYMLEKVARMDEIANGVLDNVNFFNKYFMNIKEYVEQIYNKDKELLCSLSITIGALRAKKCKTMYYKYIDIASKHLNSLKKYNEILFKAPIDIALLDGFNAVVSSTEDLINSINNEIANYDTVSKCIVYANPLRFQFKEVEIRLNEIEELFKNGKYKEAQDKLNYILSNYHSSAYEAFKGN